MSQREWADVLHTHGAESVVWRRAFQTWHGRAARRHFTTTGVALGGRAELSWRTLRSFAAARPCTEELRVVAGHFVGGLWLAGWAPVGVAAPCLKKWRCGRERESTKLPDMLPNGAVRLAPREGRLVEPGELRSFLPAFLGLFGAVGITTPGGPPTASVALRSRCWPFALPCTGGQSVTKPPHAH